jgi:hypothetical protein
VKRSGSHAARPAAAAVLVAAVALAAAATVRATTPANRAGPPPAHTGGFGEPTCHACHFDNPLNAGPDTRAAALELRGLPSAYEAGRTYRLTIVLREPDLRRSGFALSARFASAAAAAGADAGTLMALDEGVAITLEGRPPVSYAHHTETGTHVGEAGSASWSLDWRAPSGAASPVVFHVVANAANDDNSEFGDRIFARSFTLPAAASRGK